MLKLILQRLLCRCRFGRTLPILTCLKLLQVDKNVKLQFFRKQHSTFIKPRTLLDGEIFSKKYIMKRNFSSYPQHLKINLPSLSPTMERGNVANWLKKEGDKLKEGEAIAEIETDKAVMPMEVQDEGYLAKILIPAGAKDIPVGRLMCIIVQNQADVAAFKDFKDTTPATAPAAAPTPPPAAMPTPTEPKAPSIETPPESKADSAHTQSGARAYASPMAKKLAEIQQMRLQGKGSGIYESIKSTDLGTAGKVAKGPAKKRGANNYKDIPVSNVRSVIAKRLLESKTTIPHFYVSVECNMDNILRLRTRINKLYEKQKIRISINDIIIKAVAAACIRVPEANSYWMDKVIRQFEHVDVSVAVSTDGGLLTPIIFSADEKGIIEISEEMKDLAKRARTNKLKPNEYQGGTVCISNMGMLGVNNFFAIINPPQTLILAIGSTTKKLVSNNGPKGFKEINVMMVSASADHRVVDGAVCARWLQYFRDFIEEPGMIVM